MRTLDRTPFGKEHRAFPARFLDRGRGERDWRGPTLAEFARQVEHEFGRGIDLSLLEHLGFGRDESLEPIDVRSLCAQLGLPPEDFGVA